MGHVRMVICVHACMGVCVYGRMVYVCMVSSFLGMC